MINILNSLFDGSSAANASTYVYNTACLHFFVYDSAYYEYFGYEAIVHLLLTISHWMLRSMTLLKCVDIAEFG